MLKAIGRKVIIEPEKWEEDKTISGLIVKDFVKPPHHKGIIVSLGDTVPNSFSGKIGDTVIFNSLTYDDVFFKEDQELIAVEYDEIFGIVS